MQNLTHPNIVRYLGTQRDDEFLNIFLEYVPGGSIASLLSKFGPFNERIIPISVPKGNKRTLEERKGVTPTAAIYKKASHETKPLQGRARTTRKPQDNDFSRLCKQNQCEAITILQRYTSMPQLASERERPILAIQPQPVKRIALWL